MIQILGLNEVGHESGNASFCEGRDLPWLQDVETAGVWDSFDHVYRDVIIVDADNVQVAVYNLTQRSLAEEQNFAALKQLFMDARGP